MNYYGITKVSSGAGTSTYFGDLCETGDCLNARPYVSLGVSRRYKRFIHLRGEFAYYRLANQDFGGKNTRRNLSFRSGNTELLVTNIFEMVPYTKEFNDRPVFAPYAFIGVGMTYISPRARLGNEWYTLPRYDTEGVNYSRFVPMVPMGIGFQIPINPILDLNLEASYRKTFSDYFDDVSTVYTDNAALRTRDPIAAELADRTSEITRPGYDSQDGVHWNAGHKRGNPDREDGYIVLAAKLELTLNPVKAVDKQMVRRLIPWGRKGSKPSRRGGPRLSKRQKSRY